MIYICGDSFCASDKESKIKIIDEFFNINLKFLTKLNAININK